MKALVLVEQGVKPRFLIEERDIEEIKPGFARVKVHAATVNPLSNLIRTGAYEGFPLPLVLSNDGSGIVEQGTRFEKGTPVAIYGGGDLGIKVDGLQQEWIVVEESRLIAVPEGLSLDEAAALPINYVTAYQALMRIGKLEASQYVLVSGASGSVGNALIQTILALGAHPIAIVSTTEKAERARESGATSVIDLSRHSLKEAVLELTNQHGADLAMDTVGGEIAGQLLSAVRPRGAVVSIGFVGGPTSSVDLVDLVVHEKRLLGYDAHLETDADVDAAVGAISSLANTGLLKPRIDSVYPMEEYEAAYKRLESRAAMGTILLHL